MADIVKCNKCNDTGDYTFEVNIGSSDETVTVYCDCVAGEYQMAWDEVELEEELEQLLQQISKEGINGEAECKARTNTPAVTENEVKV